MPPRSDARNAPESMPYAHKRALISPSRIEFPAQRLYALSLFVLLQALKLYDFIGVNWAIYPEQYNGVVMKWWFIDAMYILLLWIVKIPWLQFSVFKSIILAFLLIMLDTALFLFPTVAISGVLWKLFYGEGLGQQISMSRAKMINVKEVLHNSSHILGRHTLQILPYGTAKLNPGDDFYCIPLNEDGKKDIYIPVILNNTIPRSITLRRFDFDSLSYRTHEFSGRDIQRATEIGNDMDGIELYYVRIQKPGIYRLENIVSSDGMDVRLYSREAYVFVCPIARFMPLEPVDYCLGEKESLQLEVIGVPPLKVEYKRSIGQLDGTLKLDRIQPPDFESPLARLPEGLSSADPTFFVPSTHSSYEWAAAQHLTIQLNLTFDQAEKYGYHLVKVTDGAGNIIDLSGSSKQGFDVHDHPYVHFQCNPTDPVRLLKGEKSVRLPLTLKGTGPWNLNYDYYMDESEDSKRDRRKAHLDATDGALEATHPGMYRLLSVSDKYCKGNVLLPSTCQVIQPPLPIIRVQSTPIPSECAGDNEIGMEFVAEFQGTPPFTLSYNIVKHTGKSKVIVEKKRERSDRSRHTFSYLPKSSGTYTYEFVSIDDRYYTNQATHISHIKQVVHPQPDVQFDQSLLGKQSIRTCLGEEIRLPLKLTGTGPFVLYWTYGKQMYSDAIKGDSHVIVLPALEMAGHHVLSLVKIQDANECIKELDARDLIIDVRRDRPTAFFYTEDTSDNTITITQGSSAQLPLRLTGEGPWKLAYHNIDANEATPHKIMVKDPNANLAVNAVGQYELVSVQDANCRGDVLPPNYFVRWIDKPSIGFAQDQVSHLRDNVFERKAVCVGNNDAVDVVFAGHGPYKSGYSVSQIQPSRRDAVPVQEEINSGLSRSRLPLRTREPGTFRYTFDKLADQQYVDLFSLNPALVLEHTVLQNPTAKFTSKSRQDHSFCVGDSLDSSETDPLWIEMTGQAPFSITIRIEHQSLQHSRVITLDNIETKKYKLSLPYELIAPGHYTIQLLSIADAHGCNANVAGAESIVNIEALDIATVTPVDSCAEICVGDNVAFSLSGMGPFTIQYQFNGRNEKIKSQTSKFSMIADRPGNLTILSVGDNRNKCRSFPRGLSKLVHEVPSSRVGGGNEVFESVREGDTVIATVDLIGTPPFDFEWQRSEVIWDHQRKKHYKGRVLESHVVHGVESHEYKINASIEGIIEVVSIRDRYCQYPRTS